MVEEIKSKDEITQALSIAQFAELKAYTAAMFYVQLLFKSDPYQDLAMEFITAVEQATREDGFKAAGIEDPQPDRDPFAWLRRVLAENRESRAELLQMLQDAANSTPADGKVH